MYKIKTINIIPTNINRGIHKLKYKQIEIINIREHNSRGIS